MCFRNILIYLILAGWCCNAYASDNSCSAKNMDCTLENLKSSALEIEKQNWRDQTLRELAKTYASQNMMDEAINLIKLITTPDTKAMTIRGIGMEAAKLDFTQEQFDSLFTNLRTQADTIEHPPSFAIALTYIAMSQAFAGDNDGAWKTAASMENDALRNKAYAETAEIQAENSNFDAAMKSIEFISTTSFRNKAYNIISKLLADRGLYDVAYQAALKITNAYKRSQSLQHLLNAQIKAQAKKKDSP